MILKPIRSLEQSSFFPACCRPATSTFLRNDPCRLRLTLLSRNLVATRGQAWRSLLVSCLAFLTRLTEFPLSCLFAVVPLLLLPTWISPLTCPPNYDAWCTAQGTSRALVAPTTWAIHCPHVQHGCAWVRATNSTSPACCFSLALSSYPS